MINQKTYVASFRVTYWVFIIFSIFLIFSFIWNLKDIFYVVYIWVLFGIVILSEGFQKRVFKIVLDKSNGKIIVYETKFFNYKQFRHEMPISEIDCSIYKVRGGGTSVYFKIEFKKNSYLILVLLHMDGHL